MDDVTNNRNFPSQDNRFNSSEDYLVRASSAVAAGDKVLGIHLYMAAFERAKHENLVPSDKSLEGMEKAWSLAVDTGQRSLAEYIFEHLEPYWSADEMATHADQLQRLALDKLEEFGLPRETLEDMAEMLNQDFPELTPELLYRFEEHGSLPDMGFHGGRVSGASQISQERSDEAPSNEASDKAENSPGAPCDDDEPELLDAVTIGEDLSKVADMVKAAVGAPTAPASKNDQKKKEEKEPAILFNYSNISGFDSAIAEMSKLGIGKSNDPEFKRFIEMLNERHGLSQMPGVGTVIFRSPSTEDANYFMVATVGEMNIPAVRMRLDQNAMGQPVLCVMTSSDFKMRINNLSKMGFMSPTVLILEDLDTWDLPLDDFSFDEPQAFFQSQLSRGAREAVALIRSAIENPEVTVFISAEHPEDINEVFLSDSEQQRIIDIDLPNEEERCAIWYEAQKEHPSLRELNVSDMVEFSASLSRFEIFAIASEAVEQAYRKSLEESRFVPVRADDIVARLANFQPLDSEEYSKMENLLVSDFRKSLDSLEDLLNE